MRIQLISDLHIDVRAGYVPALADGADLIVVAGDVCEGIEAGMTFLRAHLSADIPVLMVAGNHEFYHRGLAEERAQAMEWAEQHDIVLFDDTVVTIGGVRFVGATLWTDFALYGEPQRSVSMIEAQKGLNDFRCIKVNETSPKLFTPKLAADLHRGSVAFIERELSKSYPGPTVVITHHAPHTSSIDPRFAGDALTPAFVSDLKGLIGRHQPELWLHGHVHSSFDYHVGATRVVCNPKGYGRENRRFDPALVIDV